MRMLKTLPVLLLLASACGKDEQPSNTNIAINVAPLQLSEVSDVTYTLRVRRADDSIVWEKTGLSSAKYGDGTGALAYVGPCDADPAANPNKVELTVEGLFGASAAPLGFANPAPADAPLVRSVTCVANTDVPVDFNVTIMREANTGFFDVAVQFEDIFCSAKFDCLEDNGDPLKLLFKNGERARSVVMGFACTSGVDSAGHTETTWLHLTDWHLECGGPENPVSYMIDPSKREGNLGSVPPVLFEVGSYRDEEELPPYDKCFWNMAFGVNEGLPQAKSCVLVGQGTASAASWHENDGMSPANTIYPYVNWRVNLTGSDGAVMCGQHPLNAAMVGGTQVSTRYTDFGGSKFTHEWECGSPVVTTEKVSCSATVSGVGQASAAFTQTPEGISVAFGAELPSALYKLPAEYGEVGECCFNPCCVSEEP